MKTAILLLVIVVSFIPPNVQAGVATKAAKEGAEYLSERLGRKATREAAETAAKKATGEAAETIVRKTTAKAARQSAEQLARKAGLAASRCTDNALSAVVRYGDSAAGLINHFGDDAAQALVTVSPRNGRRLMMLEQELAQSGHAEPILKLVGHRGDALVDWLWKHRGSVAAGVGITVLLTNPDAVLNAGATVTTAALDNVGNNVVRPVTEGFMWLISRLLMLVALTAVGTYALWLKVPALRSTITALVQNGVAVVRRPHK